MFPQSLLIPSFSQYNISTSAFRFFYFLTHIHCWITSSFCYLADTWKSIFGHRLTYMCLCSYVFSMPTNTFQHARCLAFSKFNIEAISSTLVCICSENCYINFKASTTIATKHHLRLNSLVKSLSKIKFHANEFLENTIRTCSIYTSKTF